MSPARPPEGANSFPEGQGRRPKGAPISTSSLQGSTAISPVSAAALLAGSAVLCVAAVGAALVSQHVFGMEPCPYCVLQRVIFLAIALACLLGLAWSTVTGRRCAAAIVVLLALSGVAAALWQHFVAAASASCNLTLADKIVGALGLDSLLPDVFSARASCADAAVDLLGIPYEFWSLALFMALAVAVLQVFRRPVG